MKLNGSLYWPLLITMGIITGIGETRWLGFETNIWNLEPSESKPKSRSILDSCLSQYGNQYQYFSPSWLEIKTNTDTYHTWYQLGINVTRNTIFYFYSLLISHSGCNLLVFNLTRMKIERKINYFWFSGYNPIWEKRKLYSWFLYALFGSCHGIQLNQDRNQNQLEIKINTWFLFESIPKPIPKLHPNLSQYQNQGSKSKVRIQYQYWSRNQPVSHIPGLQWAGLPPTLQIKSISAAGDLSHRCDTDDNLHSRSAYFTTLNIRGVHE